ncbi:hypothetical protein GTW64_33615 [Streptomyces sp. SID4923]|nr:hypothetical protein [Streptomyces sp. SID4923]
MGLCCYYGTLLMPTIEWTRNADGGWSSDDGALLLLPLAVIAGGLFTYLAWNALRRTAVYATVACGATGATWGWYGSAGDYDIPLPEVAGAVLVAGVVAVGALVLGWWSLIDLRLFYGYPRRGRDREVAVARGYGWERGPDGGGTAVIAFRDRIGTRHDVSAPLPYELRYRPLVAVYDPGTPDDPARLRAGALFVPDERRFEVWRQLKIEFPAPGDDELWEDLHSRDPGIDLAARLRRLSERRRSGDLTAEEFQAGKWRALEEHIASRRSAWPS